jgi:hypothetical protein
MVDVEIEVPGESRRHVLRLWLDFSLPRAAPRTSDPSSPGFSDAGDGGHVEILEASCHRLRGGGVQVRRLSSCLVARLNDNENLLRWLHKTVLEGLPDA